ncbi:hypothetical protein, partial [Escherichia coli]|uniref:hypothetical protein n=2 Tax=Escherichia coli TaxID=562 RepID=UPI003A909CF3
RITSVEASVTVGPFTLSCRFSTSFFFKQKTAYEISCSLVGSGINRDYFFGFGSLTQLKCWFYDEEWRAHADASGLRISVYEVDALACHPTEIDAYLAYRGSKQVIFRRESARLVRHISLLAI